MTVSDMSVTFALVVTQPAWRIGWIKLSTPIMSRRIPAIIMTIPITVIKNREMPSVNRGELCFIVMCPLNSGDQLANLSLVQ